MSGNRATRSNSGGGCRHDFGQRLELAGRRAEGQRQQHQRDVKLAMEAAVGWAGEGERVRWRERGAFIVPPGPARSRSSFETAKPGAALAPMRATASPDSATPYFHSNPAIVLKTGALQPGASALLSSVAPDFASALAVRFHRLTYIAPRQLREQSHNQAGAFTASSSPVHVPLSPRSSAENALHLSDFHSVLKPHALTSQIFWVQQDDTGNS